MFFLMAYAKYTSFFENVNEFGKIGKMLGELVKIETAVFGRKLSLIT